MELWVVKSVPDRRALLAVLCILAGIGVMVWYRDFPTVGNRALTGFFTGALLALGGLIVYLMRKKQTVIIDPAARCITVKDSRFLRSKKRSIPFQEISEVGIGCRSHKSKYEVMYYLALTLQNEEKEYPLFSTEYIYYGSSDRDTAIGWKQRLEGYLGR